MLRTRTARLAIALLLFGTSAVMMVLGGIVIIKLLH